MDEISNKTLATLLVVAIVISLAGTFFAMRGVSQVTNYVTGAAEADVGEAKVNISSKTSITLTQATVDFGTGYRNDTEVGLNDECNMTSLVAKPDCWVNETAFNPQDFVLENDGNRFVNVTVNSTTSTLYFDNCTTTGVISGGQAKYSWEAINGTQLGCRGTLVTAETDFNDAEQLLCSNFTYSDSEDEINVSIHLDVPAGPVGECNRAVDFLAVAVPG